MQHAENTKNNDAVTKRQVQRFLQKADVPNAWKSKSKLKFQTKHQIDKKPYTQKRKLLGDVSNQDTNKVFKKQKFKHASDLGLFL